MTEIEKEPGHLSSYHGNIKMSKLMVENFTEDDVCIKLGDPGVSFLSNASSLTNPMILKQ